MAKPGAGDSLKGVGNKAGDLAENAIDGLAAGYDPNSLEAKGIGLAGDAVDALIDGLSSVGGQCHLY